MATLQYNILWYIPHCVCLCQKFKSLNKVTDIFNDKFGAFTNHVIQNMLSFSSYYLWVSDIIVMIELWINFVSFCKAFIFNCPYPLLLDVVWLRLAKVGAWLCTYFKVFWKLLLDHFLISIFRNHLHFWKSAFVLVFRNISLLTQLRKGNRNGSLLAYHKVPTKTKKYSFHTFWCTYKFHG